MEKAIRHNSPAHIIASFFGRGGCVRTPNKTRLQKEDRQKYKKGYEVRFTVRGSDELSALQAALKKAGIKCGNSYKKERTTILPVYGKESYARIMDMVRANKGLAP